MKYFSITVTRVPVFANCNSVMVVSVGPY